MPAHRTREIVLPLPDLRALFAAPDVDFFSEDAVFETGIERLLRVLRADRLAGRARAVILLPPDAFQRGLEPQVRDAIRRYCHTEILERKATLASTLWVGLKALQVGILFLVSCLALATVLDQSGVSAIFPATVASEGLSIIGWVSLWRPVEIFLYEWWPLWREVRLYDYILRMEIVLAPQTATKYKNAHHTFQDKVLAIAGPFDDDGSIREEQSSRF